MIEESEDHRFPELPNMPAGESVREFLLPKKLVRSLRWRQLGSWIKQFLGQFHQVNRKLRRLHTKSLAGLLKLQETIGDAAVARQGRAVGGGIETRRQGDRETRR